MTEREAADVRHVMEREGTTIAQKVIAVIDLAFPKLAARVTAKRAATSAPTPKSMVDYIREQMRGPAPRVTASLPKPTAASVEIRAALAPVRVPSMVDRIKSAAKK